MNWNNIAFIGLVICLLGLYSLANWKNKQKPVQLSTIDFYDATAFYIHDEDVYKLLIQSEDSIKIMTKENVNLRVMESKLAANDMIKNAQVYLDVNGLLGAEIEQRKPILRFYDNGFQYVDDEGKIMPLSSYYSARVPVAFGFSAEEASQLFPLANALFEDTFYSQQVTNLFKQENEGLNFTLRDAEFIVEFGSMQNIHLKLANFKAFYANALKEKKLNEYLKVDLQFGNQVVCTKK